MKNRFIKVVTGSYIFAFTCCAPVNFYSDKELTEKAGLKYYTEKPYLLVERDPENSRIIDATVIFLPDLANPQYIIIKGGLGSRKVELNLSHGSLSSFGSTSDTQIPESIEALAKAATGSVNALTDLNTLRTSPQGNTSAVSVELYEIIIGPGGTSVKNVEIE